MYCKNNDVLQSIANIIQDYEHLPSGVYDPSNGEGYKKVNLDRLKEHIRKWVSQFDEKDQDFVLYMINKIFCKNYISKEQYNNCFNMFAFNKNNQHLLQLQNRFLLEVQAKSKNSQSFMVEKLNDCFLAQVGSKFPVLSIENIQNKEKLENIKLYYIDDISFSGDRVVQDIKKIANIPCLSNIEIYITLWISHSYGNYHIKKELEKVESYKSKQIYFFYNFNSPSQSRVINNSCHFGYSCRSEVFFPIEGAINIPDFIKDKELYTPKYYRNGFVKNDIFESSDERDRIENIFVEKGFKIIEACKEPTKQMKPLGYSWFNGFGFGGTIFSYRNCANNTPLVFWWGDYNQNTGNAALDCWYPLFKRSTYDDGRIPISIL